jgi:plasmid rolling circle replication initiator protein Rep
VNASPGWNPKIPVGQTLESAQATTMNCKKKQKTKINLMTSSNAKIKAFSNQHRHHHHIPLVFAAQQDFGNSNNFPCPWLQV